MKYFGMLAGVLLAATACGGSSPSYSSGGATSGSSSAAQTVTLSGMKFSPASSTVSAGQTVTWKNTDTIDHTVTSGAVGAPDGKFDQVLHPGDTYNYTFSQAGTFQYFCRYHGSMGMTGSVTVGGAGTGATTASQTSGTSASPTTGSPY